MTHDNFIQRIADHIKSHYDLARQELTVVFPNKRAAFYLRNAIKENGNKPFGLHKCCPSKRPSRNGAA